jgi:HTH-type transcriptional regulator, global nitrogen regulator NrpRI
MIEKKKRKGLLILDVLKNSEAPLTSGMIAEELSSLGYEMSERTVRLYLQSMDHDGLTSGNGKKGHQIT